MKRSPCLNLAWALGVLVPVLIVALAGCAPSRVSLVGAWGGDGLALTVTDRGGALEFDCAAGEIVEPLEVDAVGRFEAAGVFIPGQGGPVRAGEVPLRRPARYAGRVVGQTMTLSLTLSDTGEATGPFRLRKDAPPQLLRCL